MLVNNSVWGSVSRIKDTEISKGDLPLRKRVTVIYLSANEFIIVEFYVWRREARSPRLAGLTSHFMLIPRDFFAF